MRTRHGQQCDVTSGGIVLDLFEGCVFNKGTPNSWVLGLCFLSRPVVGLSSPPFMPNQLSFDLGSSFLLPEALWEVSLI